MKKKFNLRSIIWLGFLGRLLVGISTYSLDIGLKAGRDLNRWHLLAVNILEGKPDQFLDLDAWGTLYAYYLAFIYFLTTDSLLIANLSAILTWVFSAFVFLSIMNMMNLSYRNKLIGLILFVFLPSSINGTSFGMRESYQLLAVNLSIWSSLIFYYHRDIRALFLLVLVIYVVSLLHVVFIIFGAVLIGMLFVCSAARSFRIKTSSLVPILALGSVAVILGFSGPLFALIGANPDLSPIGAILSFQEGSVSTGLLSRATYKFAVPIEVGGLGSITYFFVGFFQYLFEPMPWKISSILDVMLTIENIIRGIMIYLGIRAFFNVNEDDKKIILILLTSYLAVEFAWSLGTTNWGTAQRHHIPTLGLLFLIGLTYRDSIKKEANANS